jgi:arylamine N-acetyltransferase
MNNNSFQKLNEELLDKYINMLGVAKRQPGVNALVDLVAAHLTQVPFENISKLYYRRHMNLTSIPDINTYLTGIEQHHFGGTCFSNNYYFYSLLANLGYTVRLCGADMSNPDAHMALMVEVEGREFLVDVGYAAPFLLPLPRDLKIDFSIVLGRDRYVLKPQDENGRSRLEMYRNGILKHGYLAKPEHRTIDNFSIADSFREDATFMNSLLLARFFPGRSTVIHNLTVVESQGTDSRVYSLKNRDELGQAVEVLFGIPSGIVMEAVGDLRDLGDPWS